MNKILLIIQREYITRVRKKAFVIMTLLVPTLFAAMYAVIALVAGNKDQTVHIVNVVDNSGNFKGKFQDQKLLKFTYSDKSLSIVKTRLKNENDLILSIPANPGDTAEVFSRKKTNLNLTDEIQKQMNDIASGARLVKAGIDTAQLHRIKSDIPIKSSELTDAGAKSTSIGATYALSFAGAILIYMSLFIYGAQ